MIVNQGGEKKVMKKILSVALSTAMAFSMFASVAFGAEAKLTPQAQFDALKAAGIVTGYPGTDDAKLDQFITRAELAKVLVKSINLDTVSGETGYTDVAAGHWAAEYVTAASQAGILEGQDAVKKLFAPKANVTVQELAAILVRALKLEVPTDADNTASDWAKGYVAAAVKAGYIDADANYQANATRALVFNAAHVFYEASKVPPVAPVVTATKVDKVSASNLKEVVVAYDGTVDKETAENKANYTLKSGKAIKSASLSDDKKTVTLTVESKLTNNKVEFLSVANVKAGDATISAKEVQFNVADNELPEVKEVKSLGTKAIKIKFSEPVVKPVQANFELDGSAYYGDIKELDSRTYVLTPYSGALSVADHKLVVKNVKDEADFVGLTSVHEFTVVEDVTAPTITEATATLEYVTLTFSEEVDPDSFDGEDVKWKSSGSDKKASDKERVNDNTYKFFFKGDNALPTGALTIYVQDVTDFSGNKIAADTTVTVTPEVDQTRPEVTKAEVIEKDEIKVTFNKSLVEADVNETDNYTVLDKDGKVLAVASAEFAIEDGKENDKVVIITTYKDLSVGDNKLTIKNLRDNTRLKNTMLDYSTTVNRKDTDYAKIDSNILVNVDKKQVVINFDKEMDIATLTSESNYYVEYGNGDRKPLTGAIADITPLNGGKAVSIQFADNVTLGNGNKEVSKLILLGLKDKNGNLVKESVNGNNVIDVTNDKLLTFKEAKLVEKKVLELEFNSTITAAPSTAFEVYNSATNEVYKVSSVRFDGSNKVKVNLEKEFTNTDDLNVDVLLRQLTTLVGKFDVNNVPTNSVIDKVAPEVKGDLVATGNTITATFSEDLTILGNADAARLVSDFVITRKWDNEKLKTNEYSVAVSGNTVVITLADTRDYASLYSVEFKGSDLIVDTSSEANKAAKFTKTTIHKLNANN